MKRLLFVLLLWPAFAFAQADNWQTVVAPDLRGFGDTDKPPAEESLTAAVERNLTRYFSSFNNDLPPPGLYHRILKEIEYPLLSAALAATRGNQIRAADLLGVNRNTLRKKIRDLDIQVFRSGS
mgnify:CR=1 FL=1